MDEKKPRKPTKEDKKKLDKMAKKLVSYKYKRKKKK